MKFESPYVARRTLFKEQIEIIFTEVAVVIRTGLV